MSSYTQVRHKPSRLFATKAIDAAAEPAREQSGSLLVARHNPRGSFIAVDWIGVGHVLWRFTPPAIAPFAVFTEFHIFVPNPSPKRKRRAMAVG